VGLGVGVLLCIYNADEVIRRRSEGGREADKFGRADLKRTNPIATMARPKGSPQGCFVRESRVESISQ
jgi:hypothetical protein